MLPIFLDRLPLHVAGALLVGFIAGISLGQYVFAWADSFSFEKHVLLKAQELEAERKVRRAMESRIAELEGEINRIKMPKSKKDEFVEYIKNGVVKPCHGEFVLFDIAFNVGYDNSDLSPIREDISVAGQFKVAIRADDGRYIHLMYGHSKIEKFNDTFVQIELVNIGAAGTCEIRFGIAK